MKDKTSAFAYNGEFGVLVGQKEIGGCRVAVCVSNEPVREHENNVAAQLVQSYEMRVKSFDSMDF